MKKTDKIEAYSENGEVHLVIREHENDEQIKNRNSYSFIKIKTFMKKEAAKPLLLLRA